MVDPRMAATDTAPVPAPAPKSNAWLLILVVVAALLAGGAGAFFAAKMNAQAPAESAAKEEKSKPRLPAQFVKLDPPFVVNFEAKGLMRFLQVTIEVMTRDAVTLDLLKRNDPMIRNDLILLFSNQRYETISTREGKEQLRQEALKVVADVIAAEGGDGSKVEQLYFTSFVMQ